MATARASATIEDVTRSVLIVDDHHGFRSSARALLEAGGFAVVGEAATGAAALDAVARLRPEVILLDVQLPDIDGFAVAERLSELSGLSGLSGLSEPPVVVFVSSREAVTYGPRLHGARFLPKHELSGPALADILP
ncbi:response regulator [Streptosporangiaceae bacterium NEAU-GS5]|nr:response regulator [Streptosporangiaceae bacterium NEAU-GS5]